MRPTKLSGILALLLVPIVSGCAVHRVHQPLATQAVGFNLTVEQAQNEMLLLNVIRAKDRLPMYLTAISSLNGDVSASLEASLGGSYADEDDVAIEGSAGALATVTKTVTSTITRTLTPSFDGSVSRNPSFTLAVLDGEKFTRGFLAPIEQRTFAYFWDQGWPPELLLYLLVQKVVVEGRPVYWNYPSRSESKLDTLRRFGCWVERFVARSPTLRKGPASGALGPPLKETDVQDVSKLITLTEKGFELKQEGEQWRLHRVTQSFVLQSTSSDGPSTDDECSALETAAGGSRPLVPAEQFSELTRQRLPAPVGAEEAESRLSATDGVILVTDEGGEAEAALVLRSPEAVLYYLGELMRVANREEPPPKVPKACIQGELTPLFIALEKRACAGRFLVEARTAAAEYVIPPPPKDAPQSACNEGELEVSSTVSCDPGRSMQAFRLLSQLISLQKSAEELPSPALVRVIGE